NLGRFEEAIASYGKAIEFKPDYHGAWNNRGLALGNLGRFEEAIASWDKAIEFKPDFHEAWYNRGVALGNLGRNEEAIASWDKAIEFKPDFYEAWSNCGELKICQIFNTKQDLEVWRSRLTTIVNIYEKNNVLSALGQGLVNNIPEIMSEMISDKAARIWLEVWQEQTSKFDDFQIPLRLLNAAVRYRETKGDRRALLELPIEERKLLQSILDLEPSGH
ncbi:tetratricopeptide repeat protein, partial [Kamptonema animale CS-326]|uniref:tetratricopeptide repeat protein n=1 Tax=Kamptonema animale TaxID=92934 RepID=UPI00232DB678